MIKYECEQCGKLVTEADAVGRDVGANGQHFVFNGAMGRALVIDFRTNDELQQFCKGCMFSVVREMMQTLFPEPPDDRKARLEEFYQASIAVDEGTVSFDLHNAAVARLEASEAALRTNPQTRNYSYDFAVASDPGEHQELSELYASGSMPESGTDQSARCTCHFNEAICPIHSAR